MLGLPMVCGTTHQWRALDLSRHDSDRSSISFMFYSSLSLSISLPVRVLLNSNTRRQEKTVDLIQGIICHLVSLTGFSL